MRKSNAADILHAGLADRLEEFHRRLTDIRADVPGYERSELDDIVKSIRAEKAPNVANMRKRVKSLFNYLNFNATPAQRDSLQKLNEEVNLALNDAEKVEKSYVDKFTDCMKLMFEEQKTKKIDWHKTTAYLFDKLKKFKDNTITLNATIEAFQPYADYKGSKPDDTNQAQEAAKSLKDLCSHITTMNLKGATRPVEKLQLLSEKVANGITPKEEAMSSFSAEIKKFHEYIDTKKEATSKATSGLPASWAATSGRRRVVGGRLDKRNQANFNALVQKDSTKEQEPLTKLEGLINNCSEKLSPRIENVNPSQQQGNR